MDCGLQFPEDYLFGIDVVIPRFDFVLANKDKLAGIVLTHGHEDHIGALPWLMPYVDAPVYGSPFTLALCRKKLGGARPGPAHDPHRGGPGRPRVSSDPWP